MTHHPSPPTLALALLFALVAAGCAAEGVECGTIRCEPGQICAPPNQACVPRDDPETCPAADRCWRDGPGGGPGCFDPIGRGPGWCFDVPEECGDAPDCECVFETIAPLRCLLVTDDGYVVVQWL
jgi:hypothetical protein